MSIPMKQFTALALLCLAPAWADTVSPLLGRGHVVMPQPQVARLGASDFVFSRDWKLERQGVAPGDAAVEVLNDELDRRFHMKLANPGNDLGNQAGTLLLLIAPNAATIGEAQDRARDVLGQQADEINLD